MNQVHVGFGFHVNCYHSYRGDTNDDLGFGSDIRIIRDIIKTLNKFNQDGVHVRGTWDFENAYSLESILPKYAPDIIKDVKLRQDYRGDENILMGYNNGAMSAMTEDEFLTSVNWAITNPYQSGLQDVFGSCTRIIRPQEVMFTPSQAALYEKAGIDAVCLYYSCVPFDAFRTVTPQLSEECAFNPITYTHKGHSVKIIPTISQSDVMDAGSLGYLAADLHQKQLSHEINHDVFLFINIDADSFLWEPMPVPVFMKKWPNFGGLAGLVNEVKDLDYVSFDTPGGYLKDHEPLCELDFQEDTADGNFTGYSSWSEKPFNREIWTRLERARMMARLSANDSASPSFETRVRLLSTTHFGLATPVLNLVREQKAVQLSEQMLEQERDACPKENGEGITLHNITDSTLQTVELQLKLGLCSDITRLNLEGECIAHWTAVELERYPDQTISLIYLTIRFAEVRQEYHLQMTAEQGRSTAAVNEANHSGLTVSVNEADGWPALMDSNQHPIYLHGWLSYNDQHIDFQKPVYTTVQCGGEGSSEIFKGEIHIPGEVTPGFYEYVFTTTPCLDAVLLSTRVQYPYTAEQDALSSTSSNLGRYCDYRWQETAPIELTMTMDDTATVTKRNFEGAFSTFPLSDFWNSVKENENLASFNHQLTGGVLIGKDGYHGIVLTHARQVLSSMAHCPMRLETPQPHMHILHMNPFGTYYGKQRHYPSRGNGSIMDLYTTSMPQAKSLAPSYNGAYECSVQALSDPAFYQEHDLCAFADGSVGTGRGEVIPTGRDNVVLPTAHDHTADQKHLKSAAQAGNHTSAFKLAGLAIRFMRNERHAEQKRKWIAKVHSR